MTDNFVKDEQPTWSPDGAEIAFVRTEDTNGDGEINKEDNADIWIMDDRGENSRPLTNSLAREWYPAWSPKGDKVAFTAGRGGDDNIWVVDLNTGEEKNLTARAIRGQPWDSDPTWSPDGTLIAFHSDRREFEVGRKIHEIFVMSSTGLFDEEPWLVSTVTDWDFDPAWSPDGEWIAFIFDPSGQYRDYRQLESFGGEIYRTSVDGKQVERLTHDYAPARFPTWSPSSRRIAFASKKDGDWDIYIVDVESKKVTRVTDNSAQDKYPDWGIAK